MQPIPGACRRLIDADEISQSRAMSAHVTHVQREVAGEGVLNAQGPIHDVRRDIFRDYRHHVAQLAGSATEPGARGEDGASPVEVRGADRRGAEIDWAANA